MSSTCLTLVIFILSILFTVLMWVLHSSVQCMYLFYFYFVNYKGTTAGVMLCHRGVYDDKRILNLVKILQCVVVEGLLNT